MEYQKLYEDIINDLKSGKRALIRLNPDQIGGLKKALDDGLVTEELHKVLCILDHSIESNLEFSSYICRELKKVEDSKTLIYLLGASSKHVIEAAAKDGFPPSGEFMSAIKNILESPLAKEPENLEWLLRTIEQTGMKSIFFKGSILKLKPGMGSLFNQHKKASKEIIELLEKRWAPIKGGPLG